MGSWPIGPTPWRSRAGPTRPGISCARCRRIWSGTASTLTMRRTRPWACRWGGSRSFGTIMQSFALLYLN
jgi:hypothetical protein